MIPGSPDDFWCCRCSQCLQGGCKVARMETIWMVVVMIRMKRMMTLMRMKMLMIKIIRMRMMMIWMMMISRQMNKWWWLLHNSSAFPESPELNTTLGLLYIQTANHQVAKKYHQRYMEVAPRYMLLTLLTFICWHAWLGPEWVESARHVSINTKN